MVLSDDFDQQVRFTNDLYEKNLAGKLMYSQFSPCKVIDKEGNRIRYRHHCDEGVFTVEINA